MLVSVPLYLLEEEGRGGREVGKCKHNLQWARTKHWNTRQQKWGSSPSTSTQTLFSQRDHQRVRQDEYQGGGGRGGKVASGLTSRSDDDESPQHSTHPFRRRTEEKMPYCAFCVHTSVIPLSSGLASPEGSESEKLSICWGACVRDWMTPDPRHTQCAREYTSAYT